MSGASLAALAPALDGTVPDPRRFRMTIAIDGAAAWEEHGWGGREIAAGGALLRGVEPVPRCVVTTRDPDDGRTDAPVLAALAQLRGKQRRHVRDLVRGARTGARPRRRSGARRLNGHACDRAVVSLAGRAG